MERQHPGYTAFPIALSPRFCIFESPPNTLATAPRCRGGSPSGTRVDRTQHGVRWALLRCLLHVRTACHTSRVWSRCSLSIHSVRAAIAHPVLFKSIVLVDAMILPTSGKLVTSPSTVNYVVGAVQRRDSWSSRYAIPPASIIPFSLSIALYLAGKRRAGSSPRRLSSRSGTLLCSISTSNVGFTRLAMAR